MPGAAFASRANQAVSGGSVSVTNTSQSRALPRMPASHLTSATTGSRARRRERRTSSERHERSRLVPTRIWWIHSGSSSATRPGAFAAIWCRHSRAMAASASAAVASAASATSAACTGAAGGAGTPRAQGIAARGLGFGHHGERQVRGQCRRQGETGWRRRRCSSSISTSAIGARRARPSHTARISPRSRQSCADVPSGNSRSTVRRSKSVVKQGTSPPSSPPSRRASSTAWPRAAQDRRRDRATGHSYSGRAWRPAPAPRLRRPLERLHPARVRSRRTRSATSSRCSRKSGESK